jgi:hypothetical protein
MKITKINNNNIMSIFNWFFKTKQVTNNSTDELESKTDNKKSKYWDSTVKFIKQNAEEQLKNRIEQQEYEQSRDTEVKNYLLEQSNKVKTLLEGYDVVTFAEVDCDMCEVFKDVNKIPEFLEAFGKDFDYTYNVCYDSQAVIMYVKLKQKFHLTFEERYGKESDTDTCEVCGKTKEECTCKKCTCNGGKCICRVYV